MKTQTLAPVQLAELSPSKSMAEHDGWAALYDVEIDRGCYMLELAPKCFGGSTNDPKSIVILHQHDSWQPIGKASSFAEKKEGLHMDFLINTEVQAGSETDSNIRQGVLTGLSVGFDIVKVETRRVGEGAKAYEIDRITEARLREVSVVTFPAIAGARINASESKPTLTTFVINDGDAPREHLQAGDRVMLATYMSKPERVRPNPPAETETESETKDALEDATVSNAETETEPEVQPEPQSVELTEDEKYPGAREALERIIHGK